MLRFAAGRIREVKSMAEKLKYFVNGQFRESKTDKWYDLHNPSTGEITGHCGRQSCLSGLERHPGH